MATYGKKWNEYGPWSHDSVHQIKGGASRARTPGNLKATPKQVAYLISLGYDHDPRDLTRLEASDAIQMLRRRKKRT
jgi:hypothetical protein